MTQSTSGYPPIREYAFLSDCHTAALIGPDATVEWMCLPRFDGPSIFARSLDRSAGGWELSVDGAGPPERRYDGDTLVLENRWRGPHGEVVGHDFLAVHPPGPDEDGIAARRVLVRLLRCVAGTATVRSAVRARPDYGRADPDWTGDGENLLAPKVPMWVAGEPRPVAGPDGDAVTVAELAAGDGAVIALGYDAGPGRRMDRATAERLLDDTRSSWRRWSDRSTYRGVGAAQVRRSALVLRGLMYEESGGLLAAATTSLPEWIGGTRNWDYRFVWHRDASLIVLELMRLGHVAEAGRYLRFLLNSCRFVPDRDEQRDAGPGQAGPGRLAPVLTLDGGTHMPERTLDHLEGYAGSSPVRIGNAAVDQVQLDNYGHVIEAAYVYHEVTGGLDRAEISEIRRLVDTLAGRWREPDSGLWEARGESRHWVYTKLCAWVGLDRGVRLAELCHDADAPVGRWRAEASAVRHELLDRGFDRELNSFTQIYGSGTVDASALHIPLFGLVRGDDPRMTGTVERIMRELGEGPALVHRYQTESTEDGLGEPEAPFVMCSFDLVSALALAGRQKEATERFEALCDRIGPLGLLSEEMTDDGTYLGNHPQAFSHVALIEAAMNVEQGEGAEALHGWARRFRGRHPSV